MLIDASIVEVPRQRNQRWENAMVKKGKIPKHWDKQPNKLRQKDLDARWARKHEYNYYGYKNHNNVDHRFKLIRQYIVTPASTADGQVLPQLLDEENRKKRVYADNAYGTEQNLRYLMDHCYSENILRWPNGTYYRKEKNKEWNSLRCKVVHVFGFIANSMKGGLLRTIGLSRAKLKLG